MRRTLKTLTAAGTTAAILVVAAPSAAALALDDGPTSTTTAAPERAEGNHGHRQRVVRRVATRAAAESIGVSVEELRDALRGGQTIAELATSKGVDVSTVTDAVSTALQERIDAAVANGRITEERAAEARERTDEIAARIVTTRPRATGDATQE